MKIIASGAEYTIYSDNIKTYDLLPSGYYTVEFAERKGFFLAASEPFKHTESTLYGEINSKVEKVIKSYTSHDKSLGVILSGVKGIGKSLCAKQLAIEITNRFENIPIIIVDKYIDGISNFLASINQKAMILFDEFDKTFKGKGEDSNTANDPQTYMLTLFDGVLSTSNKLFVITCNDLDNISEYIVNRPGRFHYHFRFDYPTLNDIRQYIIDNCPNIVEEELESIINFCKLVPLNYDCIKAICSEINDGYTFKESINDLNIMKTNNQKFAIKIIYTDNSSINIDKTYIDIFSDDLLRRPVYKGGWYYGELEFNPKDITCDEKSGTLELLKDKFRFTVDEEDGSAEAIKALSKPISKLELIPSRAFDLFNSRFLI